MRHRGIQVRWPQRTDPVLRGQDPLLYLSDPARRHVVRARLPALHDHHESSHREAQARMNYLAYCAEGKSYNYLGDDMIAEMSNRPPLYEQPHFRDVLQG